ncbi:MAG: vWA domain-containing protein [Myxococcota bacterium]
MGSTSVASDDGAGTTTGDPARGTTGTAATGTGDTSTSAADGSTGDPLVLDVGTMPDSPSVDRQCQTAIDIVFVLDVSTSMDTVLTQLADEIQAVDDALAEYELETEPHYGMAVFVDDAGLMNDGQPFAELETLQQEFLDWAAWTAQGTQLAPAGFLNYTWPENSLDALAFAANDFQWRDADSTLRIVIHATDDTFWVGPAMENGVAIVNGYEETIAALQAAEARVFAFTADIGGQCECEDVSAGWSAPYGPLPSIPDATDGGRFDIEQIVGGTVSFTNAIAEAVEQSYCTAYEPAG